MPLRSPERTESPGEIFNTAYLAHRSEIKKRCFAILHDEGDAEDATDETFTRAWRAITNGELDGEIRPWLRVVARNVCYDVCRSRRRSSTVDTPTLEAIGPASDSSDREMLDGVDASLVRESVRRMPRSYQSILALREDLELSYKEIADREAIPISSVESRLYRARCALRREYLALVGPEGVASVIWLHIRLHVAGLQPLILRTLHRASETVTPEQTTSVAAPAGGVGSVVAATAVAALTTIGAVHVATSTTTPLPSPAPAPATTIIYGPPQPTIAASHRSPAPQAPSVGGGATLSRHEHTARGSGTTGSGATSAGSTSTLTATPGVSTSSAASVSTSSGSTLSTGVLSTTTSTGVVTAPSDEGTVDASAPTTLVSSTPALTVSVAPSLTTSVSTSTGGGTHSSHTTPSWPTASDGHHSTYRSEPRATSDTSVRRSTSSSTSAARTSSTVPSSGSVRSTPAISTPAISTSGGGRNAMVEESPSLEHPTSGAAPSDGNAYSGSGHLGYAPASDATSAPSSDTPPQTLDLGTYYPQSAYQSNGGNEQGGYEFAPSGYGQGAPGQNWSVSQHGTGAGAGSFARGSGRAW